MQQRLSPPTHPAPSCSGITCQLHGPWAWTLPICYSLFSCLLGTLSVLYGKTVAMLLRTTLSGDGQMGSWYFWLSALLFIGFAVYWAVRFNKASPAAAAGGPLVGSERPCRPQMPPPDAASCPLCLAPGRRQYL